MQNSAILRIKNQLAYRLGSTMIEHSANGGGYLSLIYKLYKIKKEYTKEQKLYKQTIKLFPQLAYPRLETCYDYNESIKYKFHLSYMLGLVLINADKNKFKGGYFTLFKDIKKARKDYKNINSMLKEFNIISSCVYEAITNNKDKFINNFEKIKEVLYAHKDYQAIIDNIFHNFDYFLNNFELIKEWLLSDDFYQRYKKENHPYPSLLDPKKLNDENEQINYHNIPAELAWEMNLPLPDNYEFV
ncbi:sugar transferase, partial [Campylobacter insulaenigrae]|nr:sugar transferase [Campylobacter insulaenigrae]